MENVTVNWHRGYGLYPINPLNYEETLVAERNFPVQITKGDDTVCIRVLSTQSEYFRENPYKKGEFTVRENPYKKWEFTVKNYQDDGQKMVAFVHTVSDEGVSLELEDMTHENGELVDVKKIPLPAYWDEEWKEIERLLKIGFGISKPANTQNKEDTILWYIEELKKLRQN